MPPAPIWRTTRKRSVPLKSCKAFSLIVAACEVSNLSVQHYRCTRAAKPAKTASAEREVSGLQRLSRKASIEPRLKLTAGRSPAAPNGALIHLEKVRELSV